MKKRILKSVIFMTLLLSVCFALSVSVSAKSVVSGDFKFDVKSSAATLIGYTGSDSVVEIPSEVSGAKVTAIGNEAFWQNKTMTEVKIPSAVTSIGDAAFNECTALTAIEIPSKVTSIGEGAFWYCTGLKTVVIPKSVTKIGENAFKGCAELTAYTVKGSEGERYIKALDYVKLAYRYAAEVKLSATSLSLSAGSVKTLTAELSPAPLYKDGVTYKSSDTRVADVDTSGNITAISAGKATITVTAKDGSKISAKCTVTVKPAKVKNLKAGELSAASAEIRWNKAEGATGYKVYKYNPSTKKYVSLGTTTKLTYTDKTAKIGESVKYKVRAYGKTASKTYYGSYSSVLTVTMPTPGTVKNLTAAASTSYAKLSWEKADTATGYRVYQYSPSKKKFVKKVSTTALKATVKKLKANTEYTFSLQAYYKDSKGKVTFADKQQTITISTRPAAVKKLSFLEGSEFFDRLSLKWTPVSGVSGYEITCTPEKGEPIIKTVLGGDTAEGVADGLSFGTEYTFKIRAFTERESGKTYSYYSDSVKASTIPMPATAEDAFSGFISALNETKKYAGNAALYKTTQITNFKGDNADKYTAVTDNAFKASSNIIIFEKGTDKKGNTPSAYIYPAAGDCVLTADKLLGNSLTYSANGSGYEISFTLPEDNDGTTAGLIAPLFDTEAVKNALNNFSLTSVKYKAVRVTAKVQHGLISHMEISQDVEVSFKIGVRSYSFTETVNTLYAFTEF